MKLIIAYAVSLVIVLVAFSYWIFSGTTQRVFTNTDKSMAFTANRIAKYLDSNNLSNLQNLEQTSPTLIKSDRLFEAIYESLILSPQRFYVQINDSSQTIWKSKNLGSINLPTFPQKEKLLELRTYAESIYSYDTVPKYIYREYLSGKEGDSIFTVIPLKNDDARLYLLKTKHHTIALAYSLENIQKVLNNFLNYFLIGVPIVSVFLISLSIFLVYIGNTVIDKFAENLKNWSFKSEKNVPLNDSAPHLKNLHNIVSSLINETVEYSNSTKEYLSEAAHEIKTPLTILRGELEQALGDEKSSEEYQAVIASSLDEVIRLSNIVHNLLDLSRAETGNVHLNIQPTNITNLIYDMISDLEIIAEEKEITITKSLQKNIVLSVDQNRIYQALMNIFENGIKYNKIGGTLNITLSKKEEGIVISVKDSGLGIQEDQIPHLFDKFYRSKQVRYSNIPGTGLGLSLAKCIIESHGGSIEVNSKLNIGSTFSITLKDK